MGSRRKSRELALQLLYWVELNPEDCKTACEAFWEDHRAEKDVRDFVNQLVSGTLEKKEEIDQMIKDYVKNWEIDRLSVIDRNIIRIGAYEMTGLSQNAETTIPFAVSINEAVEIAKKYSAPESSKFVNGILDQIRKKHTQAREIPRESR